MDVQITLDLSLTVRFGLVLLNLVGGVLPAWHPAWSTGLCWADAFGASLLFIASILLHELSHALAARALGVQSRGVTLLMFGGMAHLERDPERASAEFWMAIVGPVTTSIVLGLERCWVAAAWPRSPSIRRTRCAVSGQ